MRKICEECKKEFETATARRKYCSDLCAAKARHRKQLEASKRRHRKLKETFNAFRKTI